MTLPRLARRVPLLALRDMPVVPTVVDNEGRPTRATHVVAAWTGDLQPVRARGGSGQMIQPNESGPVISTMLAFADVLDIVEADTIVKGSIDELAGATLGMTIAELGARVTFAEGDLDEDVVRYNVDAVHRPGIGTRLDHLEVYCHVVASPLA